MQNLGSGALKSKEKRKEEEYVNEAIIGGEMLREVSPKEMG